MVKRHRKYPRKMACPKWISYLLCFLRTLVYYFTDFSRYFPDRIWERIIESALANVLGSATSSSTQSLPTDVPKRKTLPVQISNLRVDAVNVKGTPKPRDARPENQPESPSPASSPQRPSESEIERLAQMPNRPITARNESQGLVSSDDTGHSAKRTNLELMYVHRERIKHGYHSILDQLRDLHVFYLSYPTYHPTLLDPIEIQDLLDEFTELSEDLEQELHQLRLVMWRVQQLKLTLTERGTLEGSKIERSLRLFYVLNPFHEHKVSRMKLQQAFRIYDRYCQRRGRKFLTKSVDGIEGRHVFFFKGKRSSLRALVYKVTGPWQEVHDYQELVKRTFESDVWLHHARDLGSSWRRIVQAVRGAQNVMRERPGGLVRLSRLARAFDPLYVNYRVIDSALWDIENTRPTKSRLGSSIATTIPDLHDELDYPSDPSLMASASESIAAEGQEDVRTRSRMANSQILGSHDRQAHELFEKAARDAAHMEKAGGQIQRISTGRLGSNGTASKAVLRQSEAQMESPVDPTTTDAPQRPPIERSGNLVSLSRDGRNRRGFRDNNLADSVLRDKVRYSGSRVLLAIIDLLEFVKEQSDHGRRTLTNLLDLQDMKEEWQINQDRLSAAMHNHRAMARIRRDLGDMLLRNQSPQTPNTVSVTQYVRLQKLLIFKSAWGQSKKDLIIAFENLYDFQRRRGLVRWRQRRKETIQKFKPKRSLWVLGSALPELSDIVQMQYSKTFYNERDLLIIKVRTSLTRLLIAIRKWRDTLTAAKRGQYQTKNIMTMDYVRCFQQTLDGLSSTQPKAKLDRRAFPFKLGAAEAYADIDAIPALLPDLNHKLPGTLQTWQAGTPKSSGNSNSRSKRPPKSHKCSDGLHERTRTPQIVEKGSPENDFAQTSLPPHCGSSPGISKRSEAIRYVEGSLKQHVNSERILSQSTISPLKSERAVQRKSLSHTRITKHGNVKSSPIQKRAIHCSALYGPSTEVESKLPSTLLGPSKKTSCSPLGYRIKNTDLEGASRPDQNTKMLHWEYTLYRGPIGEKVKVHYCKTKADAERIARLFFDEELLGFDIEWKPSATAKEGIKKNVALIQIASEKRIALFHIARFRGEDTVDDLVTPTFKYIMQTPRITKVGVSIKADCTRLRRYMGIESRGLFELSHLYKLVKYSPSNASSVDKRLVRLAAQVEEHFGLPLWKGQDVRGSDWSSADLNYQQVQCK